MSHPSEDNCRGRQTQSFAQITDVERYPDWRKDVERVEVLSRTPLKWREYADGDVITFEMVEMVPSAKVVSLIADPDLPFGGTWTYELRPTVPELVDHH